MFLSQAGSSQILWAVVAVFRGTRAQLVPWEKIHVVQFGHPR